MEFPTNAEIAINSQLERKIQNIYEQYLENPKLKASITKINIYKNNPDHPQIASFVRDLKKDLYQLLDIIISGADCNLTITQKEGNITPLQIAILLKNDHLLSSLLINPSIQPNTSDQDLLSKYILANVNNPSLVKDYLILQKRTINRLEARRQDPSTPKEQKDLIKNELKLLLDLQLRTTPQLLCTLYSNKTKSTDNNLILQYEDALEEIKQLTTLLFSHRKFPTELQPKLALHFIAQKLNDTDFLDQVKGAVKLKPAEVAALRGVTESSMLSNVLLPQDNIHLKHLDDFRDLYKLNPQIFNTKTRIEKYHNYESSDDGLTSLEDSSTIGEDSTEITSTLSAHAKEFIPPSLQMSRFLQGNHHIKSISDLPEFLQEKILLILSKYEGSYFVIKGSCASPRRKDETRNPPDLDLEIIIPNISGFLEEEIREITQTFIANINPTPMKKIYKAEDGSDFFSLNIKNPEIGLDISFYDAQKLPNFERSWSTSEDKRIFFDKNNQAIPTSPIESKTGFYINPQSRNLILRTCLTQTLNPQHVTNRKLLVAFEEIYPQNPINLFFWDLNLHREPVINHRDIIKNKISQFCENHKLGEDLKYDFITNLHTILETHNVTYGSPREVRIYQKVFETIDELQIIAHENKTCSQKESVRSPSPIITQSERLNPKQITPDTSTSI